MKRFLIALAILIVVSAGVFVVSCRSACFASNAKTPVAVPTFSNPERVTIRGYSGPEQDAYITPDDKYLFFDSHNDAAQPCYLYWAKRIDYKTFAFMGEIQGVNYPGTMQVRGNYDQAHNFYFASTKFHTPGHQSAVARGVFNNGVVTQIAPVEGISPRIFPPDVTLDPEITPDGTTLYFSEFNFRPNNLPKSHIVVATKNRDGTFTRLLNSDELLKKVNALGPTIYGSMPSKDDRELYVTTAHPAPLGMHIYVARRNSTLEPFGVPQLVAAADMPAENKELAQHGGLSETGSLSLDGTHLYFHRVLSPTRSEIYVLTRQIRVQ